VANYADDTVSVIDTSTHTVIGSPIPVEPALGPWQSALRANGSNVTSYDSNTVSVINTATNRVIGSPIKVGTRCEGVAISPSGKRLYVTSIMKIKSMSLIPQRRSVIRFPRSRLEELLLA